MLALKKFCDTKIESVSEYSLHPLMNDTIISRIENGEILYLRLDEYGEFRGFHNGSRGFHFYRAKGYKIIKYYKEEFVTINNEEYI